MEHTTIAPSWLGWLFILAVALTQVVQANYMEERYIEANNKYIALQATVTAAEKEQATITQAVLKVRKDLHPDVAAEWATAMVESAKEYNLDPKLLVAVSIVESGIVHRGEWGYTLTSHKGAEGIMQVMSRYWAHGDIPFIHSPEDLRHPTLNIKAGAFILRHYIDMYDGDYRLGITAYNRGERAVNLALKAGRNPYNTYLPKIRKRMELLGLQAV